MDLRDMRPLPVEAVEALHAAGGTPRLLAHLLLVHDVAATLVEAVDRTWPRLRVDAGAVLLGAATHDIGKILYPEEITRLGTDHAEAGETYLLRHGFTPAQARFARTHETWASEPAARMEDLLVALADQLWKGERNNALEEAITMAIADAVSDAPWAVYMDLDDIATPLADVGPARLRLLAQVAA